MNPLDPFLAGLVAGAVLGFTGLFRTLLTAAALAAVGYLAWITLEHGPEGIQVAVESIIYGFLAPHARLSVGAMLGGLMGGSFNRIPALGR